MLITLETENHFDSWKKSFVFCFKNKHGFPVFVRRFVTYGNSSCLTGIIWQETM